MRRGRDGIQIFFFKIVSAMGCFFGCFRIKDRDRSQAHLVSEVGFSKSREPLVSRNRLSSLLSLEEERNSSSNDEEQHAPTCGAGNGDSNDKELKAEAKFLKSCGALLETPREIRKASEKIKELPHNDHDNASSKFHSWLPDASVKKLNWEVQSDKISISPTKSHEEIGTIRENPISQLQNCSCRLPSHCNDNDALHSTTQKFPNASMQCKKCVRFECHPALNSSSGKESRNCNLFESPGTDVVEGQALGPKCLPYPTPLKLTDEMQTPGTIYPANVDNLADGKNTWVRSHYFYPVLNPIENSSLLNALKEDFNAHQPCSTGDSLEQSGDASSESAKTPMSGFMDNADGMVKNHQNSMPIDGSLSDWFKPVSPNDNRNQNSKTISSGKSCSGKSHDDDRPILGTVAAHWNDEDEPTPVMAKWWDGNGIPNSTNKYKEDQKVSWHATPFEERLEKALSDERLVPQRNIINGKPIHFDESEESDTAASNFQPSVHLASTIQV